MATEGAFSGLMETTNRHAVGPGRPVHHSEGGLLGEALAAEFRQHEIPHLDRARRQLLEIVRVRLGVEIEMADEGRPGFSAIARSDQGR